MKLSTRKICIALLGACCTGGASLYAQRTQTLTVPKEMGRWIESTFAKGSAVPFSFVYDGRPSSELLGKWKFNSTKVPCNEPNTVKYLTSYLDPRTGLKAECEITGYTDFGAVEWVLHFSNTGTANSPTIENVCVADYTMRSGEGTFSVLHADGSCGARSDFMPRLTALGSSDSLYMAPEGGRSSDHTAFPFFNIIAPDGRGAVVAIGWSGSWYANIHTVGKNAASLRTGMSRMKLYLKPGEKIRTPSVCMLFWQGKEFLTGNNLFRRFMLTHETRKIDGKMADYPLAAGFEWGDPAPCNEYSCLTEQMAVAIVERYRQFGLTPEVFWLDAGWSTGSGGPNFEGKNWGNTVGSWTVDTTRFPHGLRPVSDAAHRIGSKMMVWFEPERAYEGSWLDSNHPEWLLKLPDNPNALLDLGNPEALDWLQHHIGDLLEENGIDYYRQDFNMAPSPYWESHEEQGRIGMREIRHIEGLYAYWDYLLQRFPHLLIDNCASGGRRLDFETMKRSAPLWRTDYQYGEVNGYQNQTYGISLFLPLNGTGVYVTDDYSVRSCLSSAMVINWEINSPRVSIPDMQRSMELFKELRPYFYEDYYPLTGIQDLTGDQTWVAYQLNRPADRTGVVLAFRRPTCAQPTLDVQLHGLDPATSYTVTNDNDGSQTTLSGAQLAAGLTLKAPTAPGSVLLRYKATE